MSILDKYKETKGKAGKKLKKKTSSKNKSSNIVPSVKTGSNQGATGANSDNEKLPPSFKFKDVLDRWKDAEFLAKNAFNAASNNLIKAIAYRDSLYRQDKKTGEITYDANYPIALAAVDKITCRS
jgi:hypothetical protein